MTDNKTTPEQLVREWLPEYEERWVGSIRRGRPFGKDRTISSIAENYRDNFPVIHIHFCHKHFPEALEAFARHVWEQACRECAQVYDECQTKGDYRPTQIINKIERIPASKFKLTENPKTKNEER